MPKKGKGSTKSINEKGKSPLDKMSVEQLVSIGEEKMECLELEESLKYFSKANEKAPNNTLVLDSFASLLLELQDFGSARKLLERSIQLAPEENATKYLNYAQLCEGKEAVSNYEKAVAIMKSTFLQLERQSNASQEEQWELMDLKYQISGALCSAAEIYLTDECFADNAEDNCEKYLNEALTINPQDPQPFMTLSSVRISQQKNEEALELLKKSLSLWENNEAEELPDMEFRHNTAKTFLELGEELIAIDIWVTLLHEDDQIAEIHYFLGLAYRKCSSSLAREHIARAKQLLQQAECGDDELLQDVSQLADLLKGENIETLPEDEENPEEAEEMDTDQ